jgi:hypothetical protein
MSADQLVGGGVSESDPEVGRAFEVGEQDGEGPLDGGCVCLAQFLTIPAGYVNDSQVDAFPEMPVTCEVGGCRAVPNPYYPDIAIIRSRR